MYFLSMIALLILNLFIRTEQEFEFRKVIEKASKTLDRFSYEQNICLMFGFYMLFSRLNNREELDALLKSERFSSGESEDVNQKINLIGVYTLKKIFYEAKLLTKCPEYGHKEYMNDIDNLLNYRWFKVKYPNNLILGFVNKKTELFLKATEFYDTDKNTYFLKFFYYFSPKEKPKDFFPEEHLLNLNITTVFRPPGLKSCQKMLESTLSAYTTEDHKQLMVIYNEVYRNLVKFVVEKKLSYEKIEKAYSEINTEDPQKPPQDSSKTQEQSYNSKNTQKNAKSSNIKKTSKDKAKDAQDSNEDSSKDAEDEDTEQTKVIHSKNANESSDKAGKSKNSWATIIFVLLGLAFIIGIFGLLYFKYLK